MRCGFTGFGISSRSILHFTRGNVSMNDGADAVSEIPPARKGDAYSPPMRVPFSATERFIKKTKSVAASIAMANSQKQSK